MYGIILSFIIVLFLIAFTVVRAYIMDVHTICCKKSEIQAVIDSLPDDCTVQILIGGKAYENKRARNS